jgi:CheY-like chemotaxis protein
MTEQTTPPDSIDILVVDDEDPVREVARRVLEGEGYRVRDVSSGAEAVALLEGPLALNLLIADLDMPEMSGAEMAQRIRAMRRDLKVLYVTGHIDHLMDDRPNLWAGEAYLDKPFSPEGLLEAVALILYGRLRRLQ